MNKNTKILFSIFLALILTGILFGYLYRISPKHVINLEDFQNSLNNKELEAKSVMAEMAEAVFENDFRALLYITYNQRDISYYLIECEELIFWSDNHLDISGLNLRDFRELHYIQLPNAHCTVLSTSVGNLNFIALIKIKNSYPYENDKLVNSFAAGFNINRNVNIRVGSEADNYPVYCVNGHYLFSLEEPESPLYNELLAYISATAYLLAFVFFFILYLRFPAILKRKAISIRLFLFLICSVGLFVSLLLYFNIPATLFKNNFLTPFDYASADILSSLAHLTVFTLFIVGSAALFFFHVKLPDKMKQGKRVFLFMLYPLFYVLLYYILQSLIFHSSIRLNILHINDFTILGVYAHFLIFIWTIGLTLVFLKTHNYFLHKKDLLRAVVYDSVFLLLMLLFSLFIKDIKTSLFIVPYFFLIFFHYLFYLLKKTNSRYIHLLLLGTAYAFLVVWNLLELTIEKDVQKYHILAQNIYINGNLESDPIAEVMLEDLDRQLTRDSLFLRMLHENAFWKDMQEYLNKAYFHGFWNKYDIQLDKIEKGSLSYKDHMYFIHNDNMIKGTHFYSIPTIESAMTYLGVFQLKEYPDTDCYFMRFYPRKQYCSYSFPDLLVSSSVSVHTQLNASITKYDNGSLIYSSGSIECPPNDFWIPEINASDHTSVLFEGHWHYIYKANDTAYIVVSKQQSNDFSSYIFFWLYLSLLYFFLYWLIIRSYQIIKKNHFNIGLASRFQYAFILILLLSFVTIFYVSVNFIKKRYETQQKEALDNKKNYIRRSLQDLYYFNQELNAHNMSDIHFDLLELSYTYQTDIHVFNNNGELIGSSLPLIFNRHLISNRISPVPYFSSDSNVELYEHIGELDYLVAYTDFYNGDYLQIGYIAIPFYISQEDMQQEIENYTSVIIHIYLIIIILTVLLTLIIGQRLFAPLNMLEKKLKQMRLGQRNEKIDYKINDEIGQLVSQYNRTVDELEQSAKLLAESERESAWRSMARQVAHEINNPLTPMKLAIQQLQRRKGMNDENFDEYFDRSTEMLIEQIDNLSRIASTFSNFARMPEAKYEYVNITPILKSVIDLFANNKEKTRILYKGTTENIFIYTDSEQLIQVFNNLIKNAIQAIPADRRGIVDVDLYEKEGNVYICVHDNGIGIPKDIQDKLFIPNFTTKSQGMGLGLVISKNIIQQLGGRIVFKTELNVGSTFIVRIPVKKTI